MARTAPELALPSPSSRNTPTRWRLTTMCDLERNKIHTVESGFQPGILQPRNQDLVTAAALAAASFMASTDHCPRPSPSGVFLNLGVFCKFKKYVLFTWPILPDRP
ncbi:hypothetical protein AVEN_235154-1 [Araneus ventricosus]|uniref:Uncharacterized protein n=1 Tax=Araneus ventricosus TaxID=182803 RepID=A0A4Y2DBF6_ARAVE|nr:hypothetical protein AVEN_235154-1 [Araneus ventricosus]